MTVASCAGARGLCQARLRARAPFEGLVTEGEARDRDWEWLRSKFGCRRLLRTTFRPRGICRRVAALAKDASPEARHVCIRSGCALMPGGHRGCRGTRCHVSKATKVQPRSPCRVSPVIPVEVACVLGAVTACTREGAKRGLPGEEHGLCGLDALEDLQGIQGTGLGGEGALKGAFASPIVYVGPRGGEMEDLRRKLVYL
eukprot:CAMPEP_0206042104 /NCGR_PEP_ID=MMETSP1466-20131121/6355_1 /ASSEMBLY_ACC=CAM_ASM_001126 /TAXON_ID=44452 /ORGANISM="Pavlova gyrans, Strain CCMP608" /LENGTH=199 /DNA_ID=CAMNT_0053416811 /DNA_START=90 /DNA_END=689 /DNA_ORIENTATION=+